MYLLSLYFTIVLKEINSVGHFNQNLDSIKYIEIDSDAILATTSNRLHDALSKS